MSREKYSEEFLLNVLNVLKAQKTVMGAARHLQIPRTTFQTQLTQAKKLFPEIYNGISKHTNAKQVTNLLEMWTVPQTYIPQTDVRTVLIGGDAHIWPGEPSLMWKAFVKIAKMVKPDCIVLNGDILDGARVSRHGRALGSRAPSISEEIEAARAHIKMLPNATQKIWTMGNHDQRVDNYLANSAPELEDYAGKLSDRFPEWNFCYATVINGVEVRHRFRGGIHTAWNNALHSGISMVTSHTHQLQITAVRNRLGSHYGIECGMLNDPYGPQFEYAEGAPTRACGGFVLLSFDEDFNLLPPELAEMIRGRPTFRGKYVY